MKLNIFSRDDRDEKDEGNDEECNVCEEHGHDYRDKKPIGYSVSCPPAQIDDKIYYENLGAEFLSTVQIEKSYKKVCRDCCTVNTVYEVIERKMIFLPEGEETSIWLGSEEFEEVMDENEELLNKEIDYLDRKTSRYTR